MDAYRIGIVLNLTSNANRVLGGLAKDFEKNEQAALRLRSIMDSIGKATMFAGASAGLAFGLEKAIKPAMEYQHQVALMTTAFRNQKEIAVATGAAWKTARDVLTSTPTENIKAMRETTPAFGDVDTAARFLPQIMKMKAMLTSIVGSDKADQEFSTVKLQELRGSTKDPADFARQIDLAVKAAQMTGGKVLPSDLLSFSRQGAPFSRHWTDKFLYEEAPTGMQDMGAQKFGTALTTLGQAVMNGRMTKASFDIGKGIGIIDNDAQYKVGSAGTIQLLGKKRMHGADLFDKDPLEWVNSYLMPSLLKATGGNEEKSQQLMGALLSNRNGNRAALDLDANAWRYLKDGARVTQAGGIKSYDEMMKTDPNMIESAASAQWQKMWITLGMGVLPHLLPLMVKFVEGLDKLSGIFERHPNIGKVAFAIGAGITALLGISAAVTLLGIAAAASPIVFLVSGLLLFSKAIRMLIDRDMPTIQSALELLWQNLRAFFTGLPQRLMDVITGKSDGSGDVTGVKTKAFYERNGGAPAPFVAGKGGDLQRGDVYLDKHKVGYVMHGDMERRLNGPSSGPGFHDGRRNYTPTDTHGVSGGW